MGTAACCSPYIFLVHWFLLVSYRCQLGWLQLNFMFHSWWLGFRVRVLAPIFQMQHFVGTETIAKARKIGLVTIVTWFFLRWKDLFIRNLIARHKADAVWSLHSFILLLSFIRAHVVLKQYCPVLPVLVWWWLSNIGTNPVLVLGTFQNFHTSRVVLVLGPRLIFSWYEVGIYLVLKLV